LKVGAEPKKVVILVVLLVVAAGLMYQQFLGGPETPPAIRTSLPVRPDRNAADDVLESRTAARPRPALSTANSFRPTLKKSKPGEGPDPFQLDPTLRTDLLAKVQGVEYGGAERNLFQFGAAKPKVQTPPVEPPKPPVSSPQPAAAGNGGSSPVKPAAPPINMKYFGYVNRPGDARKRAFLMDGEEILVAIEGEVIKNRYKVVRIGINSLVVEDMNFQSQQTLPLQES